MSVRVCQPVVPGIQPCGTCCRGRAGTVTMISRTAALAALTLSLAAGAIGGQHAVHGQPLPARAQHAAARYSHPMIPVRMPAAMGLRGAAGPIKTIEATNWAGYAVLKRHVSYISVTATFFVPFMNCKAFPGTPVSFSAHWVGLDGFSSKTVEQDGFSADCNGTKPEYGAWYEIFPHPEVPVAMKIYPGNSITATVFYDARTGKYEMIVRDNTNGHQFTVWRRCGGSSCLRNSAEVISEAPFVNGAQAQLADYQAASFQNVFFIDSAGKIGGVRAPNWNAFKIIQASPHAVLAVPTGLGGSGFSNYWQASG